MVTILENCWDQGVPVEHAMIIFLLCGCLLMADWGDIRALLTRSACVISPRECTRPLSLRGTGAGLSADASTSTSDLKNPAQGKEM
jgi:hypothetical protein